MVKIEIEYTGGLRCSARHEPSQTRLITDAPVDNAIALIDAVHELTGR